MNPSAKEVRDHLRNIRDNIWKVPIADDVGTTALAIIENRTEKGIFLGGKRKNKPYSSNDIPCFYLGKVSIAKGRSGKHRVKIDRKPIPPSMTYWVRSKRNGKPLLMFKGGYRAWRKLTGRGTGTVNLTYHGDLLRNLTYEKDLVGNRLRITLTVNPSQAKKARYVNAQRQFIGLNSKEKEAIRIRVVKPFFDKQLFK